MTEQEDRQARVARFREFHDLGDVAHIVRNVLDIEALALGLSAAAQIERVDGEPGLHELLGRPDILTAVRIDAVADHDDSTRLAGLPGAMT